MEHKKCHVRRAGDCKNGNHNFVVSRWMLSTNQQTANGYTCQRCLLTVEGRNEIEKLRAEIDERDLQEDSERSKPPARSKGGKSSGGETQDSQGQS